MTWYNEIETEASKAVGNWERPREYFGPFYPGREVFEKADPKTQYVLFFETFSGLDNEKTILDQANEESLLKELQPHIDSGEITVFSLHDEDFLLITALDSKGEETAAWSAIIEIAGALSDYPVLDDELYSEKEYEAINEEIDRINPIDTESINRAIYDVISDHGLDNYPESKAITAGLKALWDNLDGDSAEELLDYVADENPEMIDERATLEPAELLDGMSVSDLLDLQTALNDALRIKKVF